MGVYNQRGLEKFDKHWNQQLYNQHIIFDSPHIPFCLLLCQDHPYAQLFLAEHVYKQDDADCEYLLDVDHFAFLGDIVAIV